MVKLSGPVPKDDGNIFVGTASHYLFFRSAVERSDSHTLTHCSLAYSAFAEMRMGMSGSASFQSARKP
jgi:hypothetical protein